MKIIRLTEMTKRFVNTTQEYLNLVQNMDCGQKDGHAAEENGLQKAVQ